MNNLLDKLSLDPDYQRLTELANYFKNNQMFIALNNDLNKIKKSLISAKVKGNLKNIKEYENDLELVTNKLLSLPFVQEYYELLDNLKNNLGILEKEITKILENDLI